MLKVGEVASRAGLSVRTLHHYDEIGLLEPGGRSRSGHRLYGVDELERLQQIASLKQLGFSLEETKACLDDPRFSLDGTLELHLNRLDDQIRKARALRERLARVARLAADDRLSVDELLTTIRETTMVEKYYTKEQLDQLAARREEVGEERIEAIQNQWVALARQVGAAMREGLDPASEPVQRLAKEWRDLSAETVAGFSGGDPGIEKSLGRVWSEEPDMGAQWGMGPDVREYIGKAIALL